MTAKRRIMTRISGLLGGTRRMALIGVGGFAAAGLLLSLMTQILISRVFGTSPELDGYWIAYSWILLATFYVTPFREALTPIFFSKMSTDVQAASDYLANALGWVLSGLAVSLLVIMVIAGFLVFHPNGFESYAHVALPLMCLAPAILTASLADILTSLVSCCNRPIFQQGTRLWATGAMFLTILLLGRELGVLSIALGFVIGQLLLVIVQWHFLSRQGICPRFRRPTGLDRGFVVLGGAFLFVSLGAQLYGVIEKLAFANMQSGLVSAFQYAVTLSNGFFSLFGAVSAVALFPSFLVSGAKCDHQDMAQLLSKACHWLIFLTAGVSTATCFFSDEIVHLLFLRGQFSAESAVLTANALQLAVFTTIPLSLMALFSRALLSLQHESGLGFALIGGVIVLTGIADIAVALFFGSKTILMAHWLLSNLVGMVMSYTWVLKQLGRDNLPLRQILKPVLLVAPCAAFSGWLGKQGAGYFDHPIAILAVGGSLFLIAYAVTCRLSGALPTIGNRT